MLQTMKEVLLSDAHPHFSDLSEQEREISTAELKALASSAPLNLHPGMARDYLWMVDALIFLTKRPDKPISLSAPEATTVTATTAGSGGSKAGASVAAAAVVSKK